MKQGRHPAEDRWRQVAALLGVSADWLIHGHGQAPPWAIEAQPVGRMHETGVTYAVIAPQTDAQVIASLRTQLAAARDALRRLADQAEASIGQIVRDAREQADRVVLDDEDIRTLAELRKVRHHRRHALERHRTPATIAPGDADAAAPRGTADAEHRSVDG
jgi:hypothetical protein